MRRCAIAAITILAAAVGLAGATGTDAAIRHKLKFEWASVTPSKAFTDGGTIRFSFKLRGSGTRDLRVDIVRVGSERVRSLPLEDVPAGRRQTVGWNGLNVLGRPEIGRAHV